jgi:hypothetical protein
VKKLISILLLSLYLISTTEVYQLLKIPTLIEHYWEHKKLNPEMSLTAFLKTHYENPVKDGDYGKDQKLPFVIHSAPLTLIFTIHPSFYFEAKAEISDHYNLIKFLQKMKIFVTKDLQDPSGNHQIFVHIIYLI